ncbi:MAG: hypothetical protein PWQ08_1251 [Clostridiales bacterium]|nr:hypothetical protein [Clostridiales bacterium]
MGKLYVRIDDRLIHGQIVTAWCVTYGVGEIIAIDDALASNAMMQQIMMMGVPAGYHPKIVTAAQAKEILQTETEKTRLVITRFAKNLAQIRDEIKTAEHVNIGNCSKQADEAAHVKGVGVGGVLSFSQADIDALDAEQADGVTVICQMLPTEKCRSWDELKKAFS